MSVGHRTRVLRSRPALGRDVTLFGLPQQHLQQGILPLSLMRSYNASSLDTTFSPRKARRNKLQQSQSQSLSWCWPSWQTWAGEVRHLSIVVAFGILCPVEVPACHPSSSFFGPFPERKSFFQSTNRKPGNQNTGQAMSPRQVIQKIFDVFHSAFLFQVPRLALEVVTTPMPCCFPLALACIL